MRRVLVKRLSGAEPEPPIARATVSSALENAGVLICGLPRSGTSLMRGLIGSHPAFAVPRKEMAWWVTIYPRYRRRRDARSWQRFLRDLLDAGSTRSLDLSQDALAQRLGELSPGSHIRAFDVVLSAYANQRRRRRWGEKTLLAEFYARAVLTALPAVKVIHLIRDPRDVFASHRQAPWRVPAAGLRARASASLRGHMAWTLRNWTSSARLARANAAQFRARYLVVRYEDLVSDPRGKLEGVCAFLGEAFDPAMLDMGAYPDMLDRGGNSSFGRLDGISAAPVGRFHQVLGPRQIALCDALAGAELERNGYQPANATLRRAAALRLRAIDRPWSALIRAVHASVFRAQGIPRP